MNWLDRIEATPLYQRLRFSMNRQLVDFLARAVITEDRPYQVAEVACGSGFAAHQLGKEKNVSLSIASDINLEDFKQAKINEFSAAFILMDIFKPCLRLGSMDLVWNSSSIEELDRPHDAVAAMARLAKPNGRVFVGVPYKYGLVGILRLIPGRLTRAWLGRVYDRAELRELLEAAHLKIEVEKFYFGGVFIGILARKPAL